MKLRSKDRTHTIQNLMLRIGIIIILLLGISNFVVFTMVEVNHKKQESLHNLYTSTTIQKMYMESWFEKQSNDVTYIAQAANDLDKQAITDLLQVTIQRNQDFSNIHYINLNGDVIASAIDEDVNLKNVSECKYYQIAIEEDDYISDVVNNEETSEPRIYFSSSVRNDRGEKQGVILAVVTLDTVKEIVDFFILNKNADIYLVNKEGYMVTQPKYIEEVININNESHLNYKVESEIIEKAFNNETANNSYINYSGKRVFGDYKWINNGQWLIIAEVSMLEVVNTITEHLMLITIISLLTIVIFILISFKVSKKLTLPIKRLRKSVNLIKIGNYDHYIDEKSFVDSPIEIKELCEAFNKMTCMINDNISIIQKNEERLRQIVNTIPSGLVIYDSKGGIVLVNDKANEVLGIEEANIDNFDELSKFWGFFSVTGEPLPIDELPYPKAMSTKTSFFNYELIVKRPSEENVIISVNGTPLFDVNSNISNVLITIHDITEQKELEFKLKAANEVLGSLSYLDSLTGIANRRKFDEILESEWKRAYRNLMPLSVIMIDIDYFKEFNDHYGHQAGDECLKEVAKSIQETLKRPADMVVRYGGEEFVVILPETDNGGAVMIAEQIRKNVEMLKITHNYSAVSSSVTISLGIATRIPQTKDNKNYLINMADKALYKAKNAGRNRVAIKD